MKNLQSVLDISEILDGKQQIQSRTQQIQHLRRIDVDGLRAISIIALTLYNWKYLPGGKYAVDVFFVVSGYIISQNIFQQYQSTGCINITNFYIRRIKKIFPALIIMFILNLYPLFTYYSASQLKLSIRTMLSACFMSSNIENYFYDKASSYSIYTHLWSLGMEMQFYLICPFLVIILWLCSKKVGLTVISVFSFLSLGYFFVINQRYLSSFTHARAWEFGLGILLSFYQLKTLPQAEIKLIEDEDEQQILLRNTFSHQGIASLAGFIIILVIFYFPENSLHSNYKNLTLFVVFATLAIMYHRHGFLSEYVLGNDIFGFIGRISYATYLWQLPILVIGHFILHNSFFICISVLFFISSLVTLCVEQKIRVSQNKLIIPIILGLMGILIIIAASAYDYPQKWRLFA